MFIVGGGCIYDCGCVQAALSRWRKGVHPAGRRVRWPADLRGTAAASSTDAVLNTWRRLHIFRGNHLSNDTLTSVLQQWRVI